MIKPLFLPKCIVVVFFGNGGGKGHRRGDWSLEINSKASESSAVPRWTFSHPSLIGNNAEHKLRGWES